jgi:predicted DNA binding CopG/RHH family protein
MKRLVPRLKTDEEAEAFLAQDLSDLDFSQFKATRFEFEKKDEQINMRLPKSLLAVVKEQAEARSIPYTRLIRETLIAVFGTRAPRRRKDRRTASKGLA